MILNVRSNKTNLHCGGAIKESVIFMFEADDMSNYLVETRGDAIEILYDFFNDLYDGFVAHISFGNLLKMMVKDYNFENDNDRIQLSEEFENDLDLDDYEVAKADQSVSPLDFEKQGLTSARDLLLANDMDITKRDNWVFKINYLRLRHVLRDILQNCFGFNLDTMIDQIDDGEEKTNMKLVQDIIDGLFADLTE